MVGDPANPGSGSVVSAPSFFIVGARRSGTTLLRLILDRHSEVAIPPESHFIPRLWSRRQRYGSNAHIEYLEQFLRDLASEHRFRQWGIPVDAVRARLAQLREPTFADGIGAVFRTYAELHGKSRWGDKTPQYLHQVGLLSHLFPESRFIHLVRDGRDVALSMVSLERLHHSVASAAYYWRRDLRKAFAAAPGLGGRLLWLPYEDLVSDPENVMPAVCSFLDLGFESSMTSPDPDALERVPPNQRTMHTRVVLAPTRSLRDWRRDMPIREVGKSQSIAGSELLRAGYQLAPVGGRVSGALLARLDLLRFWVRSVPGRVRFYRKARRARPRKEGRGVRRLWTRSRAPDPQRSRNLT